MALIKFKAVQGNSKMTNWEICGWIFFALGMVVLAIPAIRAINKVIKTCGDHTRKYSMEEKHSENQEDLETLTD